MGRRLGGGGRYDRLLAAFGRPAPAAGFALGLERVMIALAEQGATPALQPLDALHGGDAGAAFAAAHDLRAAGWRVRMAVGRSGAEVVRAAEAAEAHEALLAADGEIWRLDRAGERALPLGLPLAGAPERDMGRRCAMIARGRTGGTGADGTRPLRMAVPKGALFEDSVRLLALAGIDTGDLADPGRSLIISAGDIEFIIAKPTDIPVYVAYGGVDVAIAGKDVLVEAGLDVVELADLGFGACRFVVAEPEDAAVSIEELYRHLGVIRVATKYPRITEQHFAERGVQVELVKLHGNIELAPLIGLADRIVDITATGTTLRENRLRIVEEVLPSTARFVANGASLATDAVRVTKLADRLAASAPRL